MPSQAEGGYYDRLSPVLIPPLGPTQIHNRGFWDMGSGGQGVGGGVPMTIRICFLFIASGDSRYES